MFTTDSSLQRTALLVKAGLLSAIGLFGWIVAWTNIAAYSINYAFVRHVMSMDALAPWAQVEALTHRAILHPPIHQLAYGLIIFAEFVVGTLCLLAGLSLLHAAFTQNRASLLRGKCLGIAGCGIGLVVWYFGFAVIGAEYFAMWASQWNGQTTAYLFAIFLLLTIIYLSQPEPSSGV